MATLRGEETPSGFRHDLAGACCNPRIGPKCKGFIVVPSLDASTNGATQSGGHDADRDKRQAGLTTS